MSANFGAQRVKTAGTILLAIMLGCGKPPETEPSAGGRSVRAKPESGSKEPKSIGPQFWVYDLSAYEIVDHDVVYGLGGRWISVRYRKKPDAVVKRDELVSHITDSLLADGWTTKPSPSVPYVMSTIWQKSNQDIHFTRRPKPDEPEHWFFNQTIHVSEDASVVCLYCEVGW